MYMTIRRLLCSKSAVKMAEDNGMKDAPIERSETNELEMRGAL